MVRELRKEEFGKKEVVRMGLVYLSCFALQLGSKPRLYLPEALRSSKNGDIGHAHNVSIGHNIGQRSSLCRELARLEFV
jgi:hypothetical protein